MDAKKETLESLMKRNQKEIAFEIIKNNCKLKSVITDALWGEITQEQVDFICEINQLILQYSTQGSEPDLSLPLIASGEMSLEQLEHLQYTLETEDEGHPKKGYYRFRIKTLRDKLFVSADSIAKVLDNTTITLSPDKRNELEENYQEIIALFNHIVDYLKK